MKLAAVALVLVLAAAGVAALFSFVVVTESGGTGESVDVEPLTVLAPPAELTGALPPSWSAGLAQSRDGETLLLSCLDATGDGVLSAADDPALGDLAIELEAGTSCVGEGRSADYYAGPPNDERGYRCPNDPDPALIVAIGSAGTDLLDPSAGESMGVLAIVGELQRRAGEAGIATAPVLTAAAIFDAVMPQRSLEQFLAQEIGRRLDERPCLRAVMLGHSHGGATVTAVAAALEGEYADRVYGVLLDRTTALYDRPETEYPSRIPVLNVYQMNEGWHGVPLDGANVYNIDQSYEQAPRALSDGGGGMAPVTHKTLDDAPNVQRIVVDAVMTWLAR